MLAGHIWIGKNIVVGTGDIVMLLVIVALFTLNTLVAWRYRSNDRLTTQLIERAKDLDIGEDISLLEGLWAYFGDDGEWGEPYGGVVPVMVGEDGDRAGLFVTPEKKKVEVLYFKCNGVYMKDTEREILLQQMVAAARGRIDPPWP